MTAWLDERNRDGRFRMHFRPPRSIRDPGNNPWVPVPAPAWGESLYEPIPLAVGLHTFEKNLFVKKIGMKMSAFGHTMSSNEGKEKLKNE